MRERPGEPILTTLGTALGTTEWLLVLDNCEHLLPSCARVTEALLRACPRLRILVTSREPLVKCKCGSLHSDAHRLARLRSG